MSPPARSGPVRPSIRDQAPAGNRCARLGSEEHLAEEELIGRGEPEAEREGQGRSLTNP